MKRYLIIALIGCLFLMGCQQGTDESASADILASEVTTQMNADREDIKESETVDMTIVVPGTLEWGNPLISTDGQGTLPGESLEIYAQGKARITYTGNKNYVQYITSAASLDRYGIDALKQYNEAFFEKNALVLVCETVTSGSMQVSIDQILQQDSQMTVVLSRKMQGDAGTTDMATWLIWVEVDAGWEDCQWILHNPMLKSELQTH